MEEKYNMDRRRKQDIIVLKKSLLELSNVNKYTEHRINKKQ